MYEMLHIYNIKGKIHNHFSENMNKGSDDFHVTDSLLSGIKIENQNGGSGRRKKNSACFYEKECLLFQVQKFVYKWNKDFFELSKEATWNSRKELYFSPTVSYIFLKLHKKKVKNRQFFVFSGNLGSV